MRRHGRSLALLVTSAAVVAAGMAVVPVRDAGAGTAPLQVVYIDAYHHLMVGAVDRSDRPRAVAPGLTVDRAWLSPTGATVTGFFRSGGATVLLLRTRSRSSTAILSSQGAWTVRPYDSGGALFLDGSAGVYDVSSSGTITRRSVRGLLYEPEADELHLSDITVSPARTKVAYWRTDEPACTEELVVQSLSVDASVARDFGDGQCTSPRGQVLAWLDDDTVLYSLPAAALGDPQDSVVYALDVWPAVAPSAVDTGLRGITRLEHWGSRWWFWRAGGSEYGVSPSALAAPATWSPAPSGMTIVGAVTSDPPVVGGTISNRMSTQAHLAVKPRYVTVGSAPYLQYYASYSVDPPGFTPPYGGYPYLGTTYGLLYESTNAGATWRLICRSSAQHACYLHVVTRNVWLRWRHPGAVLTRPSTSIVKKVTAVPVITVSETSSATSSATKIAGKVTRVYGTARLLRWTGSAWALVRTTSISSTGSFSFGWHVYPHGKYRVSVPATTYWGSAVRTWYR